MLQLGYGLSGKFIIRARILMQYHHEKYIQDYVTETSEISSKICGFIKICNIT
jgi:hypothetical protein